MRWFRELQQTAVEMALSADKGERMAGMMLMSSIPQITYVILLLLAGLAIGLLSSFFHP